MTVFVVVLEDRHIDLVITVHRTRACAYAQLDAHKASYKGQYRWALEDHDGADWLRLESTHEDCADGPSVRIERTELHP